MSSATSSPGRYEYLVTIPDHANSLHKRVAVRSTHLSNLKSLIDSGKVVFGGATLSSTPKEGETPDMIGSVMLIKADSEEEILELIKGDAYTKGEVWDVEKVKIVPFRCAVRTAM